MGFREINQKSNKVRNVETEITTRLSVVVTAFKRKEFLKEALLSVLDQSIPRALYEIICVLAFRDKELSLFMQQNNITEIFNDGSMGEQLLTGLRAAEGEVVAFLEDDDKFRKDKLSEVFKAYNLNHFVYYHNNVDFIDRTSKEILIPPKPFNKQVKKDIVWYPNRRLTHIIRQRGDFNMSSIAVRKNWILKYKKILSQISASPDTIVFFLLTQTGESHFFDTSRLTLYRIHESETNMLTDKERYKEVSGRFYNSRLACYEGLSNTKIKRIFAATYLLESKFGAYIAGYETLKPKFIEILKFLWVGLSIRSAFYFRLSIAVITYDAFPGQIEKIRVSRAGKRYNKIKR